MTDLSALIRFHKHELDEKQREIGEVYAQAERLKTGLDALLDERQKELDAVEAMPEMPSFTLAGFIERSKMVEDLLKKQIDQLHDVLEEKREAMLVQFAELKKYELAQEKRLAIEAKKQKDKENRMFDDIAIEGFTRRKTEEEDSQRR